MSGLGDSIGQMLLEEGNRGRPEREAWEKFAAAALIERLDATTRDQAVKDAAAIADLMLVEWKRRYGKGAMA